MLALIKSSIGTKFVIRWADLMCRLALDAIRTVSADDAGVRTVDIKRYARVEKVPGGEIESSRVLSGVMLNKDIVHPQMRRRIHKPRIVLLDCPLEYKKGESQTNIEISKEADFCADQPDRGGAEQGDGGPYPRVQPRPCHHGKGHLRYAISSLWGADC